MSGLKARATREPSDAEFGDARLIEPDGVAHAEYLLGDRVAYDLVAAEGLADQVALGGGSVCSVDDHVGRACFEQPVLETDRLSFAGSCGFAPRAHDKVDDGRAFVVARSPLDVVN